MCKSCGIQPKRDGSARCVDCQNSKDRLERSLGGPRQQRAIAYRASAQCFINEIKNLPCQDCGGRFPPECMDFDHRDPELKSFEVGARRLNKSQESRRAVMLEVSKCDLVCANCHRIRTKTAKRSGLIKINYHRGPRTKIKEKEIS